MTAPLGMLIARALGQLPKKLPRRVVTRSGAAVRGVYPSPRHGLMPWESPIERELIRRVEASWVLRGAATQPVVLMIEPKGSAGFEYTPDLAFEDRRGRLGCVECKPSGLRDDPELVEKHRAIRDMLASAAISFIEVDEICLADAIQHANARTLIRGGRHVINRHLAYQNRRLIQRARPSTLGGLTRLLGRAASMHALSRGFVFTDVKSEFNESSALLQLEESIDAAHFLYA